MQDTARGACWDDRKHRAPRCRLHKRGHGISGGTARYVLYPAACILYLLLSGCQLGYYGQAMKGHFSLMHQREPVERVLANPDTPDPVRRQLALAEDVLGFAERDLALPAEGVYRGYVHLDRDAVVWNVMAAPLFLPAQDLVLPVRGLPELPGLFPGGGGPRAGGQAGRRGLGHLRGRRHRLFHSGLVRRSLTTPMIDRSGPALVELLIHELVHRRLYIADHTRFNESLATMVAREGTLRYLAHHDLAVDLDRWRRRDQARTLSWTWWATPATSWRPCTPGICRRRPWASKGGPDRGAAPGLPRPRRGGARPGGLRRLLRGHAEQCPP